MSNDAALKAALAEQKQRDAFNASANFDPVALRYPPAADSGERNRRSDKPTADPVNRPAHYTGHASGVECITITEHFNFCIGNAIKYLWRGADNLKGEGLQDLEKASWYINREIERRKKTA